MRTLIAGGGLAGAAAACLLGPDAILVERQARPHDKVCGEFLSAEAIFYLRRLGVDPVALGAAPIQRVRLVHDVFTVDSQLPFAAMGLSRRVLDDALLARAGACGATLLLGRRVRRVVDGVAEVEGEGACPGHRLFLATGKHELRGVPRRPTRPPEGLIGLKLHLRLDPAQAAALAGTVEVIAFAGGYGGLQPIEGGLANLCLLVDPDLFRRVGDGWAGLRAALDDDVPHLRIRLRGAVACHDRPLAIARIPYGFVHRPMPGDRAGLFRLGDQAAVIPSFSGDGMSIALHTAFRACAEPDAHTYHRALRRELGGQVGRAWALHRVGRRAPGALVRAARLHPAVLRWAARLTRLPALAIRASTP